MHCQFCGAHDTKVIDSRLVAEGDQIPTHTPRRRRCTLPAAGCDGSSHDLSHDLSQADLVEIVAKFEPRIVKMAPPGERAED